MIKKLTIILMFVPMILLAQSKTVTGKVISGSDGQPLPGVTVLVKGTTQGTTTDFDGNYSIKAKQGDILVFSYIGMQTVSKTVGGGSKLNVILKEDAQALDEVVVTALGIKREAKKLGYSMTEVKGEDLANLNTVNPVSALQGQAAGVSIGSSDGGLFGSSKIQIRGISTLNSNNNQPIFVIDGVILENGVSNESADWSSDSNDFGNVLKNLNSDDYKSVSVLKGAAATALYGSRGINGVVLIETKDGSKARGLGVSIRQSLGIDHVYATPDVQYKYGKGMLSGYIGYGKKDSNGKYYRFDTNQFYTNSEGVATMINHPGALGYGPKFDGRKIIGYDGELTTYNPIRNNLLKAYDLGINSNTSVALSGGTDKGTFYLSNSYNNRTGTLPNNSFERNSLLFRGSYDLASWLKAEASISFATSTSKNPRNNIAEYFLNGTWRNWYDVEKYKQQKYWKAAHGGIPQSKYGDKYGNIPGRSIWFSYNMDSKVSKEQVVRPIVKLSANITEDLSIKAEVNMNTYNTRFEKKELGRGYANEGGEYEIKHTTDVSKTGKLLLDYNKEIAEGLQGHFILGGEIWKQNKSFSKVETDGGLIVPGKFYIGNSKKTTKSDAKIYGTKQINSLYFLGSFSYQDQLFLDVTGRNDWTSSLVYTSGEGNYSYFYPSVSASWIFDKTIQLPNWVTFGKLRASWAQVGSDTDPYAINKGYTLGRYEMDGGNFIYNNGVSTTLVDKSIKPEKKNSFEIGTDIRFFENRLGFDVAYYDETITEQIGEIPLPQESGYSKYLTNIGTLRNYGMELMITGKPIKTEDFEWSTTFNYWKNKTKIKKLHEDYGEYKTLGGSITYGNFRVGSVAYEGGEYGILMSDSAIKKYQATDKDGKAIDDPRNGMPVLKYIGSRRSPYYARSGKVEKIGKIQPDFEGSLLNTFKYKGFNLSIMLDARFGGHMASYSSRYGTAYGYLKTSLKGRNAEEGGVTWTSKYPDTKGRTYSDGVIPDGVFEKGTVVTTPAGAKKNVGGMTFKEAYEKGYVEPGRASHFIYRKNSWGQGVVNDDWFREINYVALRNISLGYNFPKTISDKIRVKNLYVGLNARNLGYLYNSLPNNINPEGFRGNSSSESFRERNFIPYIATYTMSVAIDL